MGHAAIAAYLIIVPLASVAIDRVGGHDLARIAQIALGMVCALDVFCRRSTQTSRLSAAPLLLIALFGGLAFAASLHASVPAMALRELSIFAGMVAIAMGVAKLRNPISGPARIASVASAAYVTVILILVIAGYLVGQPLNRAEAFVGYDNYRFFNHVQTAALPLAVIALTVDRERTWLRGVSWVSAVGGFALLFVATGRGTLVGIATGGLAAWVLFGRDSLPTVKNLLLAAVLGFAVFVLIFWWIPVAASAPSDLPEAYYRNRLTSDESRLLLWRIAVEQAGQSPWLGIGPMHFAQYVNVNAKAAHPHNIYLQIAAEWGLPMLCLLIGIGCNALRKMMFSIRRCSDRQQRDCGVGLFIACIAIAADGLFSGNFVMPVSQVWIAFTFGWTAVWVTAGQATKHELPLKRDGVISIQRIAAFSLVASQLWLVWSAWPEIQRLDAHVKQSMEHMPNPKSNPRFWSHGWF